MIVVPFKTNLLKPKVETTSLNPLATAEFEHNRLSLDENVEEESVSRPEIVSTEVAEDVLTPSKEPVNTSSGVYYLITGSFKSHENAERQVNMLKDEGFEPEIVNAANGFFRVSAMACNDLPTARSRKDSIAKKFPLTWISKHK